MFVHCTLGAEFVLNFIASASLQAQWCIVHDLLQACTQRILWLYAPGPHNALAAHNQSHKSARNISKQYTRLHSWPSQTETVFNQKHYWPLLWSESRCCFHGQCMVHGVFYCAGGARKSWNWAKRFDSVWLQLKSKYICMYVCMAITVRSHASCTQSVIYA